MSPGPRTHTRAHTAGRVRWTAATALGLRLGLTLGLGLGLSGCAVGPDFQAPAAPATGQYLPQALSATPVAQGLSQRFDETADLPTDWWRLFKSPELDALMQRALQRNPGLQAAQASLLRSQESLQAGYGVFFPQVSLGLDARRQQTAPIQQGLLSPGALFNVATLGLSVGYALDLFGQQRRNVEGLQAQAEQQHQLTRAAYLSLSANVVNTAIARAAYEAQWEATRDLVALQQTQIQLTEVQVRAGTAAPASLLALASPLASNQAALAALRQKVDQSEHLLSTLVGDEPAAPALPAPRLASLQLPQRLPLRLPSELVRRRPDILAAEAVAHQASAAVGVATALMLPSVSLGATAGNAARSPGQLLGGSETYWSIGPSVSLPVFQGGSQWHGREAARANLDQALASYRQTVLSALAQVADTLSALGHDAQALDSQERAWQAAADYLQQAQASTQAGLGSHLDVLAAQQQFQQASIARLQAVAQRQQDTVALLAALGGGWEPEPGKRATAPATPPQQEAP